MYPERHTVVRPLPVCIRRHRNISASFLRRSRTAHSVRSDKDTSGSLLSLRRGNKDTDLLLDCTITFKQKHENYFTVKINKNNFTEQLYKRLLLKTLRNNFERSLWRNKFLKKLLEQLYKNNFTERCFEHILNE